MDNRRRFFNKESSISGESSGSYTVVLNGQWQKSNTISNPDSILYEGVYESFSNKGVNNSGAIMYIDIEGYTNFKLYIRSYAESSYDYVMVSQLDQTITYSTSYSNTTLIKANTRGNQKSGTTINDYTLVEFTNIDGGSHRISIIYRKDSSTHSNNDRGYVLIPLVQGSVGEGGDDGEIDIDTTYSIMYTSSDGNIVTPYDTSVFGATITNNVYINGQGIISFDGPVTTIGGEAFRDCSSLTSITIPDSVTTIGDNAFYACSSLTSVTIPDSVTTIGDYAFYSCRSLTNVYCAATTPPSLGGSYVFDNNVSGRTIYVPTESVDAYKSATYWSEYADYIVGYDFSTTSIINYTTSDGQIVNARLPIISNTYSNGIGTIEFWGSIIPEVAFYYCDSLTSVTIGDSVTTIGARAFCYCTSLTSVTIPDSVTTIGGEAFRYCSRLTSVTIPDSVTTIGGYAFAYCDSLTSVTIPDSVTTIEGGVFCECYSLTSITIPDSVTTIGEDAFFYCSSLPSIIVPDSVITIGDYAFYSCSELTSATIGNGVTTIGDEAFKDCINLINIYCKATTPPSLGGSSVFDDNALGRTIYVPAGSVNTYKSATRWNEYASAIIRYNF